MCYNSREAYWKQSTIPWPVLLWNLPTRPGGPVCIANSFLYSKLYTGSLYMIYFSLQLFSYGPNFAVHITSISFSCLCAWFGFGSDVYVLLHTFGHVLFAAYIHSILNLLSSNSVLKMWIAVIHALDICLLLEVFWIVFRVAIQFWYIYLFIFKNSLVISICRLNCFLNLFAVGVVTWTVSWNDLLMLLALSFHPWCCIFYLFICSSSSSFCICSFLLSVAHPLYPVKLTTTNIPADG